MARTVRFTLLAAVGLALALSMPSSTFVAAYGGRRGSQNHQSNDYLAELTADDLRLTLDERRIDYPVDATRGQLASLVREADRIAAEKQAAAAATPSSAVGPVRVSVRYCVG